MTSDLIKRLLSHNARGEIKEVNKPCMGLQGATVGHL